MADKYCNNLTLRQFCQHISIYYIHRSGGGVSFDEANYLLATIRIGHDIQLGRFAWLERDSRCR